MPLAQTRSLLDIFWMLVNALSEMGPLELEAASRSEKATVVSPLPEPGLQLRRPQVLLFPGFVANHFSAGDCHNNHQNEQPHVMGTGSSDTLARTRNPGPVSARDLTVLALRNLFLPQVFTGIYLAAIEAVHLILLLFPICGSKIKPKLGCCSQERMRRNLGARMFVVLLPLGMGAGWLILAPQVPAAPELHGAQRRLLGSVLQENPEAFGYLLGGVGLIVSWTSRIPSFSKIHQGKAFPCLHLWARGFSALAGFLYTSAILAHDRQPEYLIRAVPWFLISLGASTLDLALIFLSCVMQSKMRRVLGFSIEATESPDTQALLPFAEREEDDRQEEVEEDKDPSWVPLHMLPHAKYLQKVAAIGRYMELTIEHVQEVGCSTSRLPADPPSLLEPPAYPPIQVIHAKVSSTSSSEVSSISSELEQKYWEALNSEQWDSEDMNRPWNKSGMEKPRAPAQEGPGRQAHPTTDLQYSLGASQTGEAP
ncbi:transmembrane protein 44 [Petaurus breviceps papuanus]|uniref:transmembrane protein 44 n=1 Tax=Petaurus breviceps papuanus TaxID=3040969 RepID=UPI0036DDB9D4